MTELQNLLDDFNNTRIWVELGALLGCMLVAWGISYVIGRGQPKESVWFGRYTLDGFLFPVLALALVYGARLVVAQVQPVALLKVAVPVFSSLAVIRLFALVLRAVFPASGGIRLLERVVSWLAWLAAMLWIVGLLPTVLTELDNITFAFGKTKVSVRTIIEGILSISVVLVVVLWISAAIESRLLKSHVSDLSMRKVASNVTRSLLLLIGFLFVLSAIGVDLTALSVLGGALGVGLGFGLQKLASNYVSGFVILLERSLRIGDTVKVDGFEGVVSDIKTRYTLIRSASGREAIVPNEKLITERVENLSLADSRVLLSTTVSVGYDSDVGAVQAVLKDAASGVDRVLKDPGPSAHLSAFGADGLEFTLWYWIADPQNGQSNVRSDIHIRMLNGLRAANIEIPYPQRVVHVKGGPALAPPVDASDTAALVD